MFYEMTENKEKRQTLTCVSLANPAFAALYDIFSCTTAT